MSKKKTGMLIALGAALGGAAAAGISYYLKYKSFNDDVDKDFHEYEDEDFSEADEEGSALASCDTSNRTYISLDAGKSKEESDKENDTKEATKDTAEENTEADANFDDEFMEETPKAPASAEITVEEDTEGTNE